MWFNCALCSHFVAVVANLSCSAAGQLGLPFRICKPRLCRRTPCLSWCTVVETHSHFTIVEFSAM
jgi:hypothetical protein